LATFIGPGFYIIPVFTDSFITYNRISTTDVDANGQASASATVTYDYTETSLPEPFSIILVGSSLLGLSIVVRRRTAKR
jgi:hypothetical protein